LCGTGNDAILAADRIIACAAQYFASAQTFHPEVIAF
jgi:hypothetical protein